MSHKGYQFITPPLSSDFEKSLTTYFKKEENKVTVGIPFKNRLDILSNTVMSLIYQTVKPGEIILVDDSEHPIDLRNLPTFQEIFPLLDYHKILWQVKWGRKLGQHHSHQIVQENAKYNLILRIDSDEIAEPNVIETLVKHMEDPKVGAVGGLVPISCPPPPINPQAANIITDLNRPNIQWFFHNEIYAINVEHLTSSYLYRKGIAKFDLNLSKAAFREETLHTFEIKRKGYKLLVDPTAITWHFRAPDRHEVKADWDSDDRYFYSKLQEWGVNGEKVKYVVCDMGKGDHVIVKSLIPRLKQKYGKIVIASCFPDVFADDDVDQISISEAAQRLGNLDRFNIYKHCIDLNHKNELVKAFENLYEI